MDPPREQREDHRKAPAEPPGGYYAQPPNTLPPLPGAENTPPSHILPPEQAVPANPLPLAIPGQTQLASQLPLVAPAPAPPQQQQQQQQQQPQQPHAHNNTPNSPAAAAAAAAAAAPPAPVPIISPISPAPQSSDLLPRKKYQGGKVQSAEELQSYYDKLANQRSFARSNPGKGAWFWEHLEPQLVRGADGAALAVKLHCRCCNLVLGASNPSRTASEHLRGGACPNFQPGAPEPPRKKRVRVPMTAESTPHLPLPLPAPDAHHHHELVDPGRLRPPVPQLPAAMVSTGAPYTYVANVFQEIQPPAKGILTHTIRHDHQLRLMLLGFAPGEEMSIPMYAAPYKASATLTFLNGEADVFLGPDTIKALLAAVAHIPPDTTPAAFSPHQHSTCCRCIAPSPAVTSNPPAPQVFPGAMVHITADVTHTVRALTPVMLMASITRL